MAFKKFDSQTLPAARNGAAIISFNKEGLISFTQRAVEILNLNENNSVSFFQDEDEPNLWYVAKETEENNTGYVVRKMNDNPKILGFNNRSLFYEISVSLKLDTKNSFHIQMGSSPEVECEGLDCYELINGTIKIKKSGKA